MLGLSEGPVPKFAKDYAKLDGNIVDAVTMYVKEVQYGDFPNDKHSYHMKSGQLKKLQQMLKTLTS